MGHLQLPLRKAPFARPTICYILGLISVSYLPIDIRYVYASLGVSIFIQAVSYIMSTATPFGISFLSMCFTIGYLQLYTLNHSTDIKLYSTLVDHELNFDAFVIDKPYANSTNSKIKVPVNITSIHSPQDSFETSIDADLAVIVFIDTELITQDRLSIGDHVLLKGRMSDIRHNPNPHSFDYKRYMFNKGFNYLLYASGIQLAPQSSTSVKGFFHKIQQQFVVKLKQNIKNNDACNIAAAMVLGHKDDLSDDIKTIYRKTGSAHIIAVSGLHIDIIAYLLFLLLGRHRITNSYLKVIQYVSLVLMVWSYALLVGSSASVVRAALMFTFYMLALITSRKTNIWNILSLTALLMLAYNPRYIYDISFQFSFIGVISIVYFFPKFNFLNRFKRKVFKWWFDALLVSIVVQVLIAPISIYYFNYFPIGFLISNSVMIFFVYIIILGSVAVIFASYFIQSITFYLASALENTITALHSFLRIIHAINFSAFENLHLSQTDLLFIYAYIGLFLFVLNKFTLNRIKLFFFIIACHLGYLKYTQQSSPSPIIIVYHCPHNNLIDFIYDGVCYAYSSNERHYPFHTESNRLANDVTEVRELCGNYYKDTYIRKSDHVIEFFDYKLLMEYEDQFENINEFDLIIAKPNYTPDDQSSYPILLNTNEAYDKRHFHNSYIEGPFIQYLK